jgi:hypothetical protein
MSTAELVFEKTRALPDDLQKEALRYVNSLLTGKIEETESRNWSRFSAEQLANQYADEDAIYDKD